MLPPQPRNAPPGSWGWIDADGAHATFDPSDVTDALARDERKAIQLGWCFQGERDTRGRLVPIYELFPQASLGRDAAIRARNLPGQRNSLLLALGALAVLLGMWATGRTLPPIVVLGVVLFGMGPFERGIDFVENVWAERLERRDGQQAADRAAARIRYALWSSGHGRSGAGMAMAAVFGGLMLLQYHVGMQTSVLTAGLLKTHVAAEPYRLWTAAYLHGGVVHLAFNGMVAWTMARVLKPLLGPGRILIVFVVGALVGSLASWWLIPDLSVGASGGIMAFVGVFAGLAIRRPALRRVGLHRIALRIFVLMTVVGLVGIGMIDNAAHAGGAVAGIAVGALLAPNAGDVALQQRWALLNILGTLLFALPAALTAWLLVQALG